MENKSIFEELYSNVKGSSISWDARKNVSEEESKHIIYGEFDYGSITNMLTYETIEESQEIKISSLVQNKKHFCDLGSGTGRICVEMALEFRNFISIDGIELLDEMVQTSNKVKENFKMKNIELASKISFIKENFFNVNLSKYDCLFMHYPMKDAEELYLKLEKKMINELPKGALIVSMIRSLKDEENFERITNHTFKAHYGNSTAYYYMKK